MTERQGQALGAAIIFAMTRDPAEAASATRRYDRTILWGCGAHPSYVARGGTVHIGEFEQRVKRFAVVGEIGLDRRSGNMPLQEEVFDSLLGCLEGQPVLLSVHSAGASVVAAQILDRHRLPGVIMHWFTGDPTEVDRLLSLGCYFSVNTAMRRAVLEALPLERLLPETDFPVARKRTGTKPGDTTNLEEVIAAIHGLQVSETRRQLYRNLRRLSVETGAIDRMPSHIADLLLAA
jgi:TatD DNase family protein